MWAVARVYTPHKGPQRALLMWAVDCRNTWPYNRVNLLYIFWYMAPVGQ